MRKPNLRIGSIFFKKTIISMGKHGFICNYGPEIKQRSKELSVQRAGFPRLKKICNQKLADKNLASVFKKNKVIVADYLEQDINVKEA